MIKRANVDYCKNRLKKFSSIAAFIKPLSKIIGKSGKAVIRGVKNHPFATAAGISSLPLGLYRPIVNLFSKPYSRLYTHSDTGAFWEFKCNKYVSDYLNAHGFQYPTKDNTYTSYPNWIKAWIFGARPYNRSDKRPFTVAELRNLPDNNKFFDIMHDINDPVNADIGDVLTYKTKSGNLHTGFRDINELGVPVIRSANPRRGVRSVPLSDEVFTDLKVLRPRK